MTYDRTNAHEYAANLERSGAKPCNCGAECIGLSDGSSVFGWRCSQCGHKWPRHATIRGHYGFRSALEEDA